MKRYISPIFCLFFAISVFAQGSDDLKGPEYKNRKPWKDPKPLETTYVLKTEVLKGPEAKNTRPFEAKVQLVSVDTDQRTERITGPEAKNRKPWEKN